MLDAVRHVVLEDLLLDPAQCSAHRSDLGDDVDTVTVFLDHPDEAGQGFVHSFSGIVLFVTALLLTIGLDSLLRLGVARTRDRGALP